MGDKCPSNFLNSTSVCDTMQISVHKNLHFSIHFKTRKILTLIKIHKSFSFKMLVTMHADSLIFFTHTIIILINTWNSYGFISIQNKVIHHVKYVIILNTKANKSKIPRFHPHSFNIFFIHSLINVWHWEHRMPQVRHKFYWTYTKKFLT